MNTVVKVHEWTNEVVSNNLLEFPQFTLRCKLGKVLRDRGIRLQELSDLTGIRIATISELSNMKRSTISVPHILVIAKALRLTDITELFEFYMPQETLDQFNQDRKIIDVQGVLSEQQELLTRVNKEKKLAKELKETEKPTVN